MLDLVDSIVDQCPSPEHTLCLLNSLQQPALSSVFPQLMESYSKKEKLTLGDMINIQAVVRVAAERTILTGEKEVASIFDADKRITVWIAVVEAVRSAANCKVPAERMRQSFAKRIKKSGRLWGYESLERYYGLLVSKDQRFEEPFRKDEYMRQLAITRLVQSFFAKNEKFLPPGFDLRDILLRYVCMNRCDTPEEKALLQETIDRIAQISLSGLTAMRYCFEFFRYGADDKAMLLIPRQSLIEVTRRYSLEQLSREIETTFIGMTWTQENYRYSIKNLLKAGVTASTVTIINYIKDSALRSNRVEPLIQMTEGDVLTSFVYLKYGNLFSASLDLLKEFVLGAPPRAKIFEKVLAKAKGVCASVHSLNRPALLQFLEALRVKYESTCPTQEVAELISKTASQVADYRPPERKALTELLDRFDWLNFESKQAEKLASVRPGGSQYRGLCNIGNSCYMNSFLQALYMTKEFRLQMLEVDVLSREKELLAKIQSTDLNQRRQQARTIKQRIVPLAELQKLFALLYRSRRPYVNPSFVKNVLPGQFRNLFQHDAGEFGRLFLEGLEGSIDLGFQGEVDVLIQCQDCQQVRTRTEKFWDFMLAPCGADTENLKSMLEKHSEPEELEKLECNHCQRVVEKSLKRTRVKKLPPYLILTLNRFTYSLEFKKKLKLGYKVDIADTIQIEEHANGITSLCTYDIYAVIVHRGTTAESGHYYTFTRADPVSDAGWICFDDSSTSELDSLQRLYELIAAAANDTPYILFYQSRSRMAQLSADKHFMSPHILSERLTTMIEKQDVEYLKEAQKPRFSLPKIPFSAFYRKDDDEDDASRPGGGNNHLIM